MIKAITPDKKLLILGLSDENIARLTKNDPIAVDASQFGLGDFKILIMHGKTELAMRDELKQNGIEINHETVDMKLLRERKGATPL